MSLRERAREDPAANSGHPGPSMTRMGYGNTPLGVVAMEVGTTPVRCALVGTGWWATKAHLPALLGHPDAEVAAVADTDLDRAREVAEGAGGVPAVAGIEELVTMDLDLDAVVVATPHATHHDIVGAALDAGLHVLVEKPLAVTGAEAWDLVERAAAARRHLVVGYTSQYTSVARDVRDLMSEGHLGDLAHVVVEFASGTGNMFAAAQSDDEESTPAADTGTYTAEQGGGQAHAQLTHGLGFLLWATGLQAEEAFAYMDRRGLEVDVVDAVAFRLDGGVPGVASSTGTAADGQPPRQRVTCYGTAGWLEHDLLTSSAVVHRDGLTRVLELDKSVPGYPVEEPARAFVDLVRSGADTCGPADAAAATVALVEAAYTAAQTGRPCPVLRRGPNAPTAMA